MISVIILTKNEEGNIGECINSVSWSDEIIVIDDFSTDKTVLLAKSLGARVFKRKLADDFASQRNFGLTKARGEWVLFIDADERVSRDLGKEIKQAVNDKSIAGFYLKRKDIFLGKVLNYGEAGNTKLLRLAKKSSGKWQRSIHETWLVRGKTSVLKNYLLHYSHPSLAQFISQVNKFSSLHAKELFKKGERFNIFKLISYPLGKFIVNYFFRLGFLDGVHGFVFSGMMSFHSFLARAKLKHESN